MSNISVLSRVADGQGLDFLTDDASDSLLATAAAAAAVVAVSVRVSSDTKTRPCSYTHDVQYHVINL